MFKRILRVILFPIGVILSIPGIIQWVIFGRNWGFELFEYSVTGEIQ